MTNPLADLILRSQRESGLTRGQLAARMRYRNTAKALRHLDGLLRSGGDAPAEFQARLISALGIDQAHYAAAIAPFLAAQREARQKQCAVACAAFGRARDAFYAGLRRMPPAMRDAALKESLARIVRPSQSIGIISGNHDGNSPEQNFQAVSELIEAGRVLGFGYAHVRAVSHEYHPLVPEPSLILFGHHGDDRQLRAFLIREGRRHAQSVVLYKSGASNHAIGLYISADSIAEEDWGVWHPHRSAARLLAGDRIVYTTRPFGVLNRWERLL